MHLELESATYIKRSEDINRNDGRAFSPGLRDDAQDGRNQLFQLLIDIPGKETYLALMDLCDHHPVEPSKKWIALHAKRFAEAEAEFDPWHSGDITQFAKEAEKTSHNNRELFELVVSRLLDLKVDLEEGDASFADMLSALNDETKHRNVIGGWLRDRSRGRYSVPQEEELADAKKPDIRIHGNGFDGPVPIELKIADNWSGAVLAERLKNQLCGQYLRDVRSNCGIFLLEYLGEKKFWYHSETRKKMNFGSLLRFLEKESKNIVAVDNKVEVLSVIGLDLTKRHDSTK